MKIPGYSLKTRIAERLYHAYAFKNRIWRKIVIRIVNWLEGGEFYSGTLRKIYSSYYGISIGMYSYGGCFSSENIQTGTEIGRYCSIAKNVYIYTRNHPLNYKSSHPFFFNSRLKIVEKDLIPTTSIVVGNDVWIGVNVIILPSVSFIGDGAVIGAGSIVTKNVPPYAIVAGNPAKVIKYRFEPDRIDKLLKEKWWNRNINELRKETGNFTMPLK
jgi:virginiamycin A acetyltransferase